MQKEIAQITKSQVKIDFEHQISPKKHIKTKDLAPEHITKDVNIKLEMTYGGYKCKMCNKTYETNFEFNDLKENSTVCKCNKYLQDLPNIIMHRMIEHPDETINSEKNDHNKLDMEYEQHVADHKIKEPFPFLFLPPAIEKFNVMVATSIRQTDINNGEMSTNEHKINIEPDPEFVNNDEMSLLSNTCQAHPRPRSWVRGTVEILVSPTLASETVQKWTPEIQWKR